MNIYEDSQIRGEATGPSTEVSHITTEDGIRVHLKGHPHYIRGYPTFQAVQAINIVKKALTSSPLTVALTALAPCTMRPHLMCPPARAIRALNTPLATVVAHIVEYDSAYRIRLQDAVTNVSPNALQHAPIRSIWACVAHNRKNDYLAVHKKLRRATTLLTALLLWPPFRRAWHRIDFNAFLLDDADRYWLAERGDYGKNNLNPIV